MRIRDSGRVESLQMWVWGRLEGIRWVDKKVVKKCLKKIREVGIPLPVMKKKKKN